MYVCNVYENGFISVWLSRKTADFDKKWADQAREHYEVPRILFRVVVRAKPGRKII